MADAYTYRSFDDLRQLGLEITDAIARALVRSSDQLSATDSQLTKYRGDRSSVTMPSDYTTPPVAFNRYTYQKEVEEFAAAEYSFIPALFTSFATPDPAMGQPGLDALYRAAWNITPSFQLDRGMGGSEPTPVPGTSESFGVPAAVTIGIIQQRMGSWTGAGADAFGGYMHALNTDAGMHWQALISLATVLEAQIELKKAMLTDVWTIGTLTVKAIDSFRDCSSSPNLGLVLTVLGAVLAVALAAPTDGLSLAAGAVFVTEGVNSAASILTNLPTPTKPLGIGGATVGAVVDSMRAAITVVQTTVTSQQADLVSCLQQLTRDLVTERPLLQLIAPPTTVSLLSAGVKTLKTDDGFSPK